MKKELAPLSYDSIYAEKVEAEIIKLLKEEIYLPLILKIDQPRNVLTNSDSPLLDAIRSGRVYFYRGHFKGRFSAPISRELRRLGAKWDSKQGSFAISSLKIPENIKHAVLLGEDKFRRTLDSVDSMLEKILPKEVADNLDLTKIFDRAIFRVEEKVSDQLSNLIVEKKWTPEQRKIIASEYNENMKLYIQEWTEKEIVGLRKKMQSNVVIGKRYEGMVSVIKESYGVSHSKAKFLARQETNLLTVEMQKRRYIDAGVMEYRWSTVVGSVNHPVRHSHKILDGKVFRWDDAPITDEKGSRNHPGQDYGCRCKARPIVTFKKEVK